ncbi:twin-arginine translocase subunit TatC [Arcanobacterium bovis]|uniref:Sec-independent protein translocase protein TatC n=1 Tax=Arcanobacterium bovis TaxID=2529275 RepID=A0A4Q9V117_9ACTO|nr:twin-arginine translocase subunit TatC [Arcanobacterium bovis]TBW22780.1 twin-arginine translocase subunit TatC [Arcanobacterium bovis]
MPIREHFQELRKRLLLSIAGICLAAIAGWYLYDPVLVWIQAPLKEIDAESARLNFQTIGAAFDLKLRMSFWIGTILASPWWVYQMFAFISPGLRKKERRNLLAFGFIGVILFAAGAASAILMIPRAVEILASFTPPEALTLLRADSYISFYTRLVLAFGLSFLIPEILVVLNFLGLLSSRNMLKAWRWAVVIAFTFAAIANPLPSPWPMTIQAAVLIVLYLLAIGISALHERSIAKRSATNQTIERTRSHGTS